VDKDVWKEVVGKDVYKKTVESYDRGEEGFHTMERESIPFAKRRERGSKRICERAIEEGIYLAVKVTANSASVFCGKERWKEEDGTGLQIS